MLPFALLDLTALAATYYLTFAIIYVGIPFWFIATPGFPKAFRFVPRRSLGKGILLATLLMWLLMLIHRTNIEVPYNMANR